jgi:hypothetical protein
LNLGPLGLEANVLPLHLTCDLPLELNGAKVIYARKARKKVGQYILLMQKTIKFIAK